MNPVIERTEWLYVALLELGDGVAELPGDRNNPRVVEYHASTGLGASPDAVPWCSSFVNWCMKRVGIPRTKSAAARSWLNWGEPTDRPGGVAVLTRGPNPAAGHVGFYLGEREGSLYLLGGNQGDRVSIAKFPVARLLGIRWPS